MAETGEGKRHSLPGGALTVLVPLCGSAWAAAWIALFSELPAFAGHRPIVDGVTVFCLLAAVSLAARFVLMREWSIVAARFAILGVSAAALAVALLVEYAGTLLGSAPPRSAGAPLLAGLVIGVGLSWWGIALGRSELRYDDVHDSFVAGLIAMLASVATAGVAGRTALLTGFAPAVLVFFSTGLVSLSLARIRDVQEEARLERGLTLPLNRRWLTILLALVAAMLVVAVLVSSIISLAAVRALLTPVGSFLDWASNGLFYLLLPIGYLVAIFIDAARWLIARFGASQPPPPLIQPDVSEELRKMQTGHGLAIARELAIALKLLAISLLVLVVALVFARSVFRHWRRPEQEGTIELHESVFDRAEFWASLLRLLLRLLSRFRRAGPSAARPLPIDLAFEASPPAVRSVREVYRHLLARMAGRGLPRPADETPYDYARRLERQLPANRSGIEAITDAYVEVRYAERPASEAELRQVREAWAELEAGLSGQDAGWRAKLD